MKKRTAAIIVGAALLIAAGLGVGLPRYAEKLVADEIRRMADQTPWIEKIAYETLRVTLLAPRMRLGGVSIGLIPGAPTREPVLIRIDEVIVEDFKLKSGFPDRLRVTVKGLKPDSIRTLPRPIRAAFQSMDRGDLSVDMEYAHAYDGEKRELILDGPRIRVKKLGRASLHLRLLNIDPEKLIAGPGSQDAALMAALGVSAAGGELRYTDHSLVARLRKTEAGGAIRAWNRAARDALRDMENGIERGKNPSTRRAWRVMADFLADPREIRVTAAPKRPVPFLKFAWIKTPEELMDLLEVSMETRGSGLK
ncbi:MAG: hypothetical protein GY859_10035 [Desulfobacterales bacterium]|nr:hypothetical protein [Desulfobacterales bacterium]